MRWVRSPFVTAVATAEMDRTALVWFEHMRVIYAKVSNHLT